jgi:hypothetical protein
LRIAEEDLDVGGDSEVFVASELGTPIPRQGPAKLRGKLTHLTDERGDDGLGVFAIHMHQHGES